jgi:hypothetical protein
MLGGCVGSDPVDTDEPTSEAEAALASQCEAGRNGFIDIPDTLIGTLHPVSPVSPASGVVVSLEVGTVAGAQRGWARIGGSTHVGDLVWMDWTQDGRKTWLQCGPFAVDSAGHPKTSAAKQTTPSPLWQFRACGRRIPNDSVCTSWW